MTTGPITPRYPRCPAPGCASQADGTVLHRIDFRSSDPEISAVGFPYACSACIDQLKLVKGPPIPWPPGAASLINADHPHAAKTRVP